LIVILQADSDPDRCTKSLLDSFDRTDEVLWWTGGGKAGFEDSLPLASEGSQVEVGGSLSDSKIEFHGSFSFGCCGVYEMIIMVLINGVNKWC
jgi:hypothetical protein